MKQFTDEQLVRLYLETQKNAYFEELYRRYADKVYRKCLSFVRDEALAEDYAHDIFLKLMVNLSHFRETARFSTWLYSITYNFCVDQVRSTKRLAEESLSEEFDVQEEDVSAMETAEMEAKRLNAALMKLPAEERSILLMKYQDDLSIKEIADAFQLSESAVKMRLLRGKEKVRKIYLETFVFWSLLILRYWNSLNS